MVPSFSLRISPWYPTPSEVRRCFVLGAYEPSGTLSWDKKKLLGITELCSLESPAEIMVRAQLGDTTGIASSWSESGGSPAA